MSIYGIFYNKYSISCYNMITNYKTEKTGVNPTITALWPENLGENHFLKNFVLLKWEQFTVVNITQHFFFKSV